MSGIDDLLRSDEPDILDAAEQLAALLDLPSAGLRITRVQMHGQGAAASLDIALSNGETLRFASIRDAVRPQLLLAELVACGGPVADLKQPQCLQAVRLARLIAERAAVATDDDIATEWAVEYLQQAETIDVDLAQQAARYAAFEHLQRRDPWSHAREHNITFAASTIVLRDATGDRLIRTEWFLRHVRGLTARETPQTLAMRLPRIGWQRRGRRGRIKATSATGQTLAWAFWIAPHGWEDRLP